MLKDVREAPKASKAAEKGKGGAEAMSDVPTFDTFETEEEVRISCLCAAASKPRRSSLVLTLQLWILWTHLWGSV